MTQTVQSPIKLKHKALWALGDYDAVATEVIPELGGVIVDAAGIERGTRVLDVAAGSGNASLVAAERGADVVASDLTPELLATGQDRAAERGLTLDWVEADAEFLPFADARLRRHPLVRRRHVRAVPSAGRRRAGPGHQAGRDRSR